jgi:hydrogenase maturation factor
MPIAEHKNVLLAHGGGGKLMHQLLEKIIFHIFITSTLNNGTMGL